MSSPKRVRRFVSIALPLAMWMMIGCRTTAPQPERGDRALFEERRELSWEAKKLSGASKTAHEVALLVPSTFAFDRWMFLGSEPEGESIWLVLYTTLDWLARRSEEQAPYRALMAELEPSATLSAPSSPQMIEATFLATSQPAQASAREGIALRLWRVVGDRVPTLTVVMWRADKGGGFDRVLVWTHADLQGGERSAFISPECVTEQGGIVSTRALQRRCERGEPKSAFDASEVSSLYGALDAIVWPLFSGTNYLESALRARQVDAAPPLHPALSAALGVTLRERELEEVLIKTAFPPHVDLDAIFTR